LFLKQYIAYKGREFTIEWHYDSKGKALALDFFKKQSKDKQRKLLNLIRLIGEQGKIFDTTKFRNEGDKIYAFKPQLDRYLCFFFREKKIIITNAFTKKNSKITSWAKRVCFKSLPKL
jgi:hypothetical protein